MSGITIALDLMGGDKGPLISVPAAKLALSFNHDLNLVLYGTEQEVVPLLKKEGLLKEERVLFINSEDYIAQDDELLDILRHRRNSSLWMSIKAVQEKKASGIVSGGNTVALVAIANHLLGTIDGIHRSALVKILPSINKNGTVFLDLGANLRVDAEILYKYAIMGNALAISRCCLENPRVALLNIGSENAKGPQVIHEAAELMKNDRALNFVGFVEGDDIFGDKADVIVTDGFSGNVALKTAEGLYRVLEKKMNGDSSPFVRMLFKPLKNIIKSRIGYMKPDSFNGSSLIGLNGVVVKSHGGANIEAFANAIMQAYLEVQSDIKLHIVNGLISK